MTFFLLSLEWLVSMWSFAGGRGKEKLEPDDDVPENEQVNTG